VEHGERPEVGPEDSRHVLLLAEAALKSSRSGKPVRL
jgi:predicted dehydrogenase